MYFLNLQAKEESKYRDVEVPLSPEQPHVHLDLSVKVTPVGVLAVLLWVQSNNVSAMLK
jgi:hypothetical protein